MIKYIIVCISIYCIWYCMPRIKRIIQQIKDIKLQIAEEEKTLLEQKRHKTACDKILHQLGNIPVVNEVKESLDAAQNLLEIKEEIGFESFDERIIAIAKESNSVPLDWVSHYYEAGTVPLAVYVSHDIHTLLGFWASSNAEHFKMFAEDINKRRYFTLPEFCVEPNTDIRVLEALQYKDICFFAFRGFMYNSTYRRFTFLLLPFTVIEDRHPPRKTHFKPVPVLDPVYN
jgi:hypothetical protein